LSEVRLEAGNQRREEVRVVAFLDDVAASGMLHAEYRHIQFTFEPVDPQLTISADPQLLSSAVLNLLHNAFKYTIPGGRVTLRAHAENQRVFIEVEDQCGGITHEGDLFQAFGERRGVDRSGLGLGLAMARKAVTAHGGEISVRNMPAKGCVFVIELPLARVLDRTAVS
jgi:signal transduction histidine kinase